MTGVAIAIGILAVVIFIALAWWRFRRGPKLSGTAKSRILSQWEQVKTRADPHRRILEADSVLSSLLGELGFSGTTGDKLKKGGKYLPDINAVWHAHKLRNQIAHEPGMHLDDGKAARALAAFEKVISKFCR